MGFVQRRDSGGWQCTSRLRDLDLSLCRSRHRSHITPFHPRYCPGPRTLLHAVVCSPACRFLQQPLATLDKAGECVLLCATFASDLQLSYDSRCCVPDQSGQLRLRFGLPDCNGRSIASPTRASCTSSCLVLDPFQPSSCSSGPVIPFHCSFGHDLMFTRLQSRPSFL